MHEIRARHGASVCIILHWRGTTQIIALPHYITCKQLWIWLSYFTVSKITHRSLFGQFPYAETFELAATLASTRGFSHEHTTAEPLDRFHPTQLIQQTSIHTAEGLDLRLLPESIGHYGHIIRLHISCPTGRLSQPRHFTSPAEFLLQSS